MDPEAAVIHGGQPQRPSGRTPPRWILLVLVCLALVVRGRVMLANFNSLVRDPDAYQEVAWNIFSQGTFGYYDDKSRNVEPKASRPPLYPLLLATVHFLRVPLSAAVLGFLHVVLGVGTVWAVWRLGLAWGLPPLANLLAAGLITVDPILLNQSVQAMTETLATLLATLALLALSRAANDSLAHWSALAGALVGLCVLCRPTFLVWLLCAAVVFPWIALGAHKFLRVSALVVAAAAVLAPWAIRNQIVYGRPIITTTHGGYTLLLANNPEFYEYLRSAPWGRVWDAEQFNRQWEAERGSSTPNFVWDLRREELDDDSRAYQVAWENIQREPLMFAYACLVRVGRLWGVMPHQTSLDESTSRRGLRYAIAIWYVFVLSLAAVGAWRLGRKLLADGWIWGTLLLISFTVVHVFYWTDLRMRAPLMSVVVLLATQGVLTLAARRQASNALVKPA
jgi:4-amino-4-deoxy-L-arabinose transferase-like glycosyltransferase